MKWFKENKTRTSSSTTLQSVASLLSWIKWLAPSAVSYLTRNMPPWSPVNPVIPFVPTVLKESSIKQHKPYKTQPHVLFVVKGFNCLSSWMSSTLNLWNYLKQLEKSCSEWPPKHNKSNKKAQGSFKWTFNSRKRTCNCSKSQKRWKATNFKAKNWKDRTTPIKRPSKSSEKSSKSVPKPKLMPNSMPNPKKSSESPTKKSKLIPGPLWTISTTTKNSTKKTSDSF